MSRKITAMNQKIDDALFGVIRWSRNNPILALGAGIAVLIAVGILGAFD